MRMTKTVASKVLTMTGLRPRLRRSKVMMTSFRNGVLKRRVRIRPISAKIKVLTFLNNKGAFSSSTRQWIYDTRKGFTSQCDKGIKLPRGELMQRIINSPFSIIVFSVKNDPDVNADIIRNCADLVENYYAESKWCSDELAEIAQCSEKDKDVKNHPVFYGVDPSEIRNQKGKIVEIPSMAFLNNEGDFSSSSTCQLNYDVFLSFRGEDTREGFTSHLYNALCHKGIYTFIDDKLPRGEEILEELIQTIKNSSILVIVFSENYAESKWCLDELVEIVKCRKEDQKVKICPVFYNVNPSEIRNLKGKFGSALANHEKEYENNKDKVQRWRDALRYAANASGWHYQKGCCVYKSESHFIETIVEEISNVKPSWTQLYVAEHPTGIDYRAANIVSLLDIGSNDIHMVGIHGLPGVGKTTIAKAIYNRIAKKFDGSSFLENVREKLGTDADIITLQEQLLKDILGDENLKVGNRLRGISLIEKRLRCKKVLLILDDVNDWTIIEKFLGKCDWFATGSRVIITLRDRCLLDALKEKFCTTYMVQEFKLKELNKHEALQLFRKHAFSGNKPHDEDYSKLETKFVDFANGLPLALEIIARDLCGKSKNEWKSTLDMYSKIPNKDIQKILRVSYDRLNDIEKDIFLDIACFFKGWYKDYVVKILDACELYPSSGIPRLVNKCLIVVDQYGKLSMHDLIQQMGKEVVRLQAPDILEERSRLYCYKDSLEVLTRNKGSKKIRGIMLHSSQPVEVQLHTKAFRKMENLKFLIVENVKIYKPLEFLPNKLLLLKWPQYPFHWPSEYFPEQLVAIEMPDSHITLPKPIKQEWRLENSINVNLRDCKNLVEIDECFGSLEKLKRSNLANCRKLQILPSQLRLKSLVYLDLSDCSRLEKLPNFHPEMKCLESLYLNRSGIRELPSSIEHLTNLYQLRLYDCKNLRYLPHGIYKLQQLQILWTPTAKLRPTCNSFDSSSRYGFVKMKALDFQRYEAIIELDLLMKPDYFPTLEFINLSKTNIVTIPESFSRFPRLKSLYIDNCKFLREIQGLPQSISCIDAENCVLLDTQSPSGLLNQVIEIIGILPSRVCGRARSNKLMDPQLTNYFPSEIEGAESEDGDISMDLQFSNHFPSKTGGVEYEDGDLRHTILVWGTEMPKWFNHQSVDNSIVFFVGRKFPKLAVCIDPGQEIFSGFVHISINGYEKSDQNFRRSFMFEGNNLYLFSPNQWSLQRNLNESNPTDQNLVKVSITYNKNGYSVKRWGVHVECACPPQESAIPNLPLLMAGHDDDDACC